ncbi:autophagy protein Apg6-domain-containing protein [Lipomyces japonicus]|uniref:autophagy protein Apg6-domain-containing protein n=1 Tax=Lipomyces japonicus TaxID=56871 RepID=UPI0034CFFC59
MLSTTAYADAAVSGVHLDGASSPGQVCQRCRLPLRLHGTQLNDIDTASFDQLLSGSASDGQEESKLNINDGNKQNYPNYRLDHYKDKTRGHRASGYLLQSEAVPSESFVVLTESQVANAQPSQQELIGNYEATFRNHNKELPAEQQDDADAVNGFDAEPERYSLSSRLRTSDKILDVIKSKTDLDHPICSECMDQLVEGLKQQYIEVIRDRDAYAQFLSQVQNEKPTAEQQAAAEKELQEIIKEQDGVLAELRSVEQERRKVEHEIQDLERQSKSLDEEERKFWEMRNAYSAELEEFLNKRDAIKTQYVNDSALLDKLKKTNVYSDIFAIEGGSAAVDRMAGLGGRR